MGGVADRHRERVGGVVGVRRAREAEQRPDHVLDLRLAGGAIAADRHLHRLRRVVEAGHVVLRRGEHRDAARLADRGRRAHVLAEVEVLERKRRRLMPADQLLELRVDPREPRLQRPARRGLDHAAVNGTHLPARNPDDAEAGVRQPGINAHHNHHPVLILRAGPDASPGGAPARCLSAAPRRDRREPKRHACTNVPHCAL